MCSMISVTYGRSAMISRHPTPTVPLPQGRPTMPVNKGNAAEIGDTLVDSFLISVKLSEIINQVVLMLYTPDRTGSDDTASSHPNPHHVTTDELARVLQIDNSLSKLEDSLPGYLKSTPLDHRPSCRQATILRTRYVTPFANRDHDSMLIILPIMQVPTCTHVASSTNACHVLPISKSWWKSQ